MVTFPLRRSDRIAHATVVENLKAMGFVRCLADGLAVDLGDEAAGDPARLGADLGACGELLVVVDRLAVGPETRERLADSVQTAFEEGEGECVRFEYLSQR